MNAKRRNVIILCVFITVAMGGVFADDIDDFVSALNQAWSQTNDVQTLQVINSRLATNTNDALALSCKMYYYIFAEGNLTNARSAADQFMSALNSYTNADMIAYAQEMRDEIYSMPLGALGPYMPQQQSDLRQLNLSFPFIQKSVVVARWLEQ